MRTHSLARAIALAWPVAPLLTLSPGAFADHPKDTGVVTITASNPTSLPTQVPATMEGITARQIEEQVNATDSEDALKYLPSLLVRKRYIGDYNHAILSSRASGTGNSARSAVYADGILLSNYLGNGVGGLSFPPRWGMVTPDEIERVDVMYGPFSAAYPGNSVGAVVDYTTRMPEKFEGSVKVGYTHQPFDLYSTHARYGGWQSSAALGSRSGDWAWRLDFHHSDSQGQPLTFGNALRSSTAASGGDTVVTGAVPGQNKLGQDWLLLGTGTQVHTVQDHFKAKLAYDFSPTVRATYTLASWQNTSQGRPTSYLRDANGQPVYSGNVNIDGKQYTLNGGTFPLSNEALHHTLQGLSVKSRTQGVFDWEVAASLYDDKGWALHNPSRVQQFFSKFGFQDNERDIDLSIAFADNRLYGNQNVPVSMLANARSGYTHSDYTNTRNLTVNLKGSLELGEEQSIAGNVYYRWIQRDILNSNLNGEYSANQGNWIEARDYLELALKLRPSYAIASANLGEIYVRLGAQSYENAAKYAQLNQGQYNRRSKALLDILKPPPNRQLNRISNPSLEATDANQSNTPSTNLPESRSK